MEVLGLSLLHSGVLIDDTLVCGDIHLGYEENLIREGVFIPKHQLDDIKQSFRDMSKAGFTRIILNGDIKHEFSRISAQERKEIADLIRHLRQYGEVVVNRGNHDNILLPLLEKIGLGHQESCRIGKFLITHGDVKHERKKGDTLVLSHDHPAITFTENSRKESFKCFLIDERRRIVVLPSLHSVSTGTDVLTERPLSPYFSTFNPFTVYVPRGDDILCFGKVKELKKKY